MIKRQLKDLCSCLLAYLCVGIFFAYACGFYDWQGQIYFDLQGAINGFLIFGLCGFCACFICKIQEYNNDDENND